MKVWKVVAKAVYLLLWGGTTGASFVVGEVKLALFAGYFGAIGYTCLAAVLSDGTAYL